MKKSKKNKARRRTRARVGKASSFSQGWDFEELAYMGLGGLGAKAMINPLGKAIFKGKAEEDRPKYFPILAKAGLTIGLHMVDAPEAQMAKKGAALATIFEAAEIFVPTVFAPRIRGVQDEDWDSLAEEIVLDLSDINGYDDFNDFDAMGAFDEDGVLGVEDYEHENVL